MKNQSEFAQAVAAQEAEITSDILGGASDEQITDEVMELQSDLSTAAASGTLSAEDQQLAESELERVEEVMGASDDDAGPNEDDDSVDDENDPDDFDSDVEDESDDYNECDDCDDCGDDDDSDED